MRQQTGESDEAVADVSYMFVVDSFWLKKHYAKHLEK
jgi:hypothetical protein